MSRVQMKGLLIRRTLKKKRRRMLENIEKVLSMLNKKLLNNISLERHNN